MTHCEFCGKGPASVSTRDWALCKPCFYELRRQEQEDCEVPNGPTCATCATVLMDSGLCAECFTRNLVDAHAAMRSAS